ncbi:MAG: hypothetical protein ACRD3G_03500 [Vicinamibacterales bacterium]
MKSLGFGARLWTLAAAGLAIASIVTIVLGSRAEAGVSRDGNADAAAYRQIVDRMQSGSDFYAATGTVLRSSANYPVASVFNWREPLLPAGIAVLSERGATVVLWMLALFLLVRARPLLRGVLGALPILPALLMVALHDAVFFAELWAGLCLGHSVASYARNQPLSGVAWAVLALFFRELAAPFCVVAGVRALWQRERSQIAAWAVGGVAFVAYYGWHLTQVLSHIQEGDPAQQQSWLAFGGLSFLLHAFRNASGLLIGLPPFLFGVLVAFAVGAWWSTTMIWHVRAGVMAYAVFFLFFGLPFNGYWGLIVGPLFGMWLAHGASGVAMLAQPGVKHASTIAR